MKIGGATVNQIPFDWDHNSANIIDAIHEGIRQQVKILCLPELCITGYGCEDLFLSDWLSERAWQELLRIREHCDNITVSVGLPIRLGGITYNGACVISNKAIKGITLKQNLARDGVHYEPRWFNNWTKNETREVDYHGERIVVGDLMYTIDGIRLGFEICEDAWRKHNRPGYRLYDRGVDLIFNPSASHYAMGKSLLREDEVVTEGSSKFHCVYVFANLLGNEAGRMIYDGDIIIGQHGKLVGVNKRLSFKPYNLMATEINFREPEKTEILISSDIKDKNEELAQALSLALFDYLRKSKANGYVLSLSGGADSSICAVMVAEMVKRAVAELGWEKTREVLKLKPHTEQWQAAVGQLLTCAYQGTRNSSTDTYVAAEELARSVGAAFHRWDIDDEVNSYTQKITHAIGRELKWDTDDITLQNIQARTRSPIIWMLANVKRAVLLTTSNRSEGDVGYATMDGDTSGSLAPIAGLSKVFILQWLRWAEQALQHDGLSAVNNLQPTAELRPLERQQTDESDLMPYPVLAEIERHAIQERKSPLQVFEAMKTTHEPEVLKRHIRKFFTLWSANQWKRERLAPSFHLDDINVDPRSWCRFPILSSGFAAELALLP
ncbi:NAD+ synthase (glutamine-hydrolysing) [Chryseolinea serpens]|uniref:Glutamine-dependent NAD(+) synthetase n=1 Tax=Chryseolinea serpens TaxID=947013 RepID=A0A1M5MFW6_9BACT|nr:nitrilase-related carbon-nitrogen hydrolase [Chryseolinea serpens]SHG75759.1 NAD+ synthase (glutamine-hydrolysing) [Chryseolinea serpens]